MKSEADSLAPADIVLSLNGRDKGKRFIIIGTEDEYVLLADGKSRKYEKPKRKKSKHVKFEDKAQGSTAEKIITKSKVTNSELRKYMAEYAAINSSKGDMQTCQRTT